MTIGQSIGRVRLADVRAACEAVWVSCYRNEGAANMPTSIVPMRSCRLSTSAAYFDVSANQGALETA
jgi:hypothetical protein